MKPVRLLLIILGIFVLLGVVAVALALNPAVQRWAVLRAAAREPALNLRLESISAGPASLALRGVQFEQRGVKVTLDRLDADYSLFHLVFGSRLEVNRLVAAGLTVDARQISRSKVLAGAVAAPAALVQVRLPLELVAGDLTIEGRALLPGAPGRPAVTADFKISGGQFAPGREGVLRLNARLVDPLPGARVSALELQAGLQVKQSLARTVDRIGLTALIDAAGPRISGQNQLKVAAELLRTLSGESYLLHVDTLNNGHAEDILVANARLPHASRRLAGEWSLTARSAQIEPFIIGGALPTFDAGGSGTFELNAATREVALRGSLQADISELEALWPALRALGELKLKSEFDVVADRGSVQLNRLEVSVAGEQPVLELHASSALAYNLKEHRLQLVGAAPGASALAAPGVSALAAPTASNSSGSVLAGAIVSPLPAPVASAVPGEVARLKLAGVPVAWIRPLFKAVDVSGGALTGEIALVSGAGRSLVAQTVVPLHVDGVTVVRAGRALLNKAEVGIDAEAELIPAGAQARVRAFTVTTPAGDAIKAHATLTTPLEMNGKWPVTVVGDFTAELPALFSPWLPDRPVRMHGAADCTVQLESAELRRLTLEADDEDGQLLAAVGLTRAFGLEFSPFRADTGASEVELARVRVGTLPLALFIRPRAGLSVSGTTSPGELAVSAQGDLLTLKAPSPLLVTDVSVTRHRGLLLENIAVEFSPTLDLAGGTVNRATSGEVTMRDAAGTTLAKFNAEWGRPADPGLRATATFMIDLPALASQPLLARAEALSAGQASGEIRAAALEGGVVQVEARATLNGLVARDGGRTLPVANLSFRSVQQADGHLSIEAPILLDSAGQRSDLNFSADGLRQNGVMNFDARLTGGHIELGDLLLLAGAAGEPLGADAIDSAAAQGRALSPPAADERPFWAGFNGQVALDFKEVVRGRNWTMSALTGRLAIGPEHLELQKLAADFGGDAKLFARGSLEFTEGINPYHFTGDFALTKFDSGMFFKALDPDRAPTVEGICDVSGLMEGQGLTLGDTLDRTRGQFELKSGKGVFRGLKRASGKVSMASKAVQWSAALGSLLKTDRVKEAAEKVAGSSYYVDQLAQALAEFEYDQLSLKLVRDESLNVRLQDVNLMSADVRLLGSGQVTYEPGKPLLEQPLSLSLKLASRGRVEQILGKLHLLDGTRDELDYARVKDAVTIGGTLARPDPIPYYLNLLASKLSD